MHRSRKGPEKDVHCHVVCWMPLGVPLWEIGWVSRVEACCRGIGGSQRPQTPWEHSIVMEIQSIALSEKI